MLTDSLADCLTRIRNASAARHRKVDMEASRLRLSVIEKLKERNFIRNYRLFRRKNIGIIRVYLHEYGRGLKARNRIEGIERVSRPSRRIYMGYRDIKEVRGGLGMAILSTPKGILTDAEARQNKVGGEVLCKVW